MNRPRIFAHSVTTTATQILKANPKRKAVFIYNNGTATVYLLSDQRQVAANGIPIPVGTGYDSDHYNCQGDYWIIGSGTDDIRVEETLSG